MSTINEQIEMNDDNVPEPADLFDEEAGAWLDFEEQPTLIIDTEPARVLARQKEMMDRVFGGIGAEKKVEKQIGLALQQLDVEQRHALRLLLMYETPAALTTHLERCLADPAYGYGERGDNGRTIAQAMAAVAEDDQLGDLVAQWLAIHREFQQNVLRGVPFNFLSMYHYADVDAFIPLVQRIGDDKWRLGVAGQGKHRDFSGPPGKVWPRLCDANVAWLEEDNAAWLNDLKKKAARQPDSILRAARADRLRKETNRLEIEGARVKLMTDRGDEEWPQMVIFSDREGVGLMALSRLSGHSFYELSWNGGLNVRYFEISGTTRKKIPFEHVELATMLAEALALDYGVQQEPVSAGEVEAAYLRRMKAPEAVIAPPPDQELPQAVSGQPFAAYRVGEVIVTILQGGEDFAYIAVPGTNDAIVLRKDEKRGVLTALPAPRGRPRRNEVLMSTPLAELNLKDPNWLRAVGAWGAWLVWALHVK